MIAVDPYVDHKDLQEAIDKRIAEGYVPMQIIPCASSAGRDYATVIWKKVAQRGPEPSPIIQLRPGA